MVSKKLLQMNLAIKIILFFVLVKLSVVNYKYFCVWYFFAGVGVCKAYSD